MLSSLIAVSCQETNLLPPNLVLLPTNTNAALPKNCILQWVGSHHQEREAEQSREVEPYSPTPWSPMNLLGSVPAL